MQRFLHAQVRAVPDLADVSCLLEQIFGLLMLCWCKLVTSICNKPQQTMDAMLSGVAILTGSCCHPDALQSFQAAFWTLLTPKTADSVRGSEFEQQL